MAYTINRTNGTVLTVVDDYTVNTDRSVTMLGKHSPSYGEVINENFIRLLENSSNPAQPSNPVVGQLWFDTTPSNLGLNVCITETNGSTPAEFNPVALLTRSASAPSIYGLGKLWHDTVNNQLRSYNGVGTWDPIGVTNLDSITDVTITTPTNGQVLKYDSATSTWKNGTSSGSGASLPADAIGYLYNDGTGTLSWGAVGGSALPSQVNNDGKYLSTNGTTASWANISYTSLSGKPTIPAAQIQSDWNQTTTSALDYIKNKPSLSSYLTSAALSTLTDVALSSPTNGQVLKFNGTNWINAADATSSGGSGIALTDLSATTASTPIGSGSLTYNNASGLFTFTPPVIPAAQIQSDWNQTTTSALDYIKNKPSLPSSYFSGNYNDLTNKPTLPAAQIQSDWSQTTTSSLDYIKNKPIIPVLPANANGYLKNDGSGTYSWVSANTLFTDTIVDLGSISGSTTIDRALGSIFKATAVGSFTVAPANFSAGQSFTLIVTQDFTGGRLASYPGSFKFAGGVKTLSTAASAIDMLNVFYDGTTYYTTLTTGYTA